VHCSVLTRGQPFLAPYQKIEEASVSARNLDLFTDIEVKTATARDEEYRLEGKLDFSYRIVCRNASDHLDEDDEIW
jgi:hypothetical protein